MQAWRHLLARLAQLFLDRMDVAKRLLWDLLLEDLHSKCMPMCYIIYIILYYIDMFFCLIFFERQWLWNDLLSYAFVTSCVRIFIYRHTYIYNYIFMSLYILIFFIKTIDSVIVTSASVEQPAIERCSKGCHVCPKSLGTQARPGKGTESLGGGIGYHHPSSKTHWLIDNLVLVHVGMLCCKGVRSMQS